MSRRIKVCSDKVQIAKVRYNFFAEFILQNFSCKYTSIPLIHLDNNDETYLTKVELVIVSK